MTYLPSDANLLPYLVRLGERLLKRDGEIDSAVSRNRLIDDAIRFKVRGAACLTITDVVRMIHDARAEVDRDLDGNYSLSMDTVALLRTLEEACRIEGADDAGHHLRSARRAVQLKVASEQRRSAA